MERIRDSSRSRSKHSSWIPSLTKKFVSDLPPPPVPKRTPLDSAPYPSKPPPDVPKPDKRSSYMNMGPTDSTERKTFIHQRLPSGEYQNYSEMFEKLLSRYREHVSEHSEDGDDPFKDLEQEHLKIRDLYFEQRHFLNWIINESSEDVKQFRLLDEKHSEVCKKVAFLEKQLSAAQQENNQLKEKLRIEVEVATKVESAFSNQRDRNFDKVLESLNGLHARNTDLARENAILEMKLESATENQTLSFNTDPDKPWETFVSRFESLLASMERLLAERGSTCSEYDKRLMDLHEKYPEQILSLHRKYQREIEEAKIRWDRDIPRQVMGRMMVEGETIGDELPTNVAERPISPGA